ncbi:MAG: hypothetical protein JKY34_05430 [Kordiimonadaceae bacterium]|nr:hypothetical protein [Kordiimonadaceae bacterium]
MVDVVFIDPPMPDVPLSEFLAHVDLIQGKVAAGEWLVVGRSALDDAYYMRDLPTGVAGDKAVEELRRSQA